MCEIRYVANCIIGIEGSLVDCKAKACSKSFRRARFGKMGDVSILDPGLIPVFLLILLLPLH